ncbi:fumarylacetoacetate hydrolase family protein [Achromobacter spanius]|uniref:2-keto-4-pentenoate hydratase n=1 Tax=Achromobacter spanius TaxID=217203 RepID=UPI0032085F8D
MTDAAAFPHAPPDHERRRALVHTLAQARRLGRQVQDVEDLYPIAGEEQAFRLMLDVAREVGWERRGWKIAATNPLLQQKLRTKGPVCGATFSRFHVPAPAILRRDELLDPVIECEFFFTLGQALPPRPLPYAEDEVAAAVSAVNLGIEVAECRYPRRALPSAWHVYADGFASGRYLHGPVLPRWRARLDAGIGVTLLRNGVPLGQGSSHDVMGHPLRAVVWLANRLRLAGIALHVGDTISSGSCNILASARAGDRFTAQFHGAGDVCLEVV